MNDTLLPSHAWRDRRKWERRLRWVRLPRRNVSRVVFFDEWRTS